MASLIAALVAILLATSGSSFAARWSEMDAGLPSTSFGVTSLAIDPAAPSTLYALTTAGVVFKSTDAGGSWWPSNGIVNVYFLAIAPKNSTLYAITSQGIVKSVDGGESWSNASSGLTGDANSLAINPIDPTTLYAATATGIFKSADAGRNWNAVGSGSSPATQIFDSLVIDPITPCTIYAPHSNRGMVKSTDGGGTWTVINPDFDPGYTITSPLDTGYTITSLAVDPANSSTLYAGFVPHSFTPAGESPTGGVFKSTDGGKAWNEYQNGIPATFFVTALTIDPLTPSIIYAVVTSNTGGGVVKTTDGGQTWNTVNEGLPRDFRGSLAVDPVAPSTLYAGSSSIGATALFKSTGRWKLETSGRRTDWHRCPCAGEWSRKREYVICRSA
jgi:photosystem II stability/assembly factor-like uncharacterized protein